MRSANIGAFLVPNLKSDGLAMVRAVLEYRRLAIRQVMSWGGMSWGVMNWDEMNWGAGKETNAK